MDKLREHMEDILGSREIVEGVRGVVSALQQTEEAE